MPRNSLMNRISIDPKIRFGKPCIKGTRIAVCDILNMIRAGYPISEIPVQYPGITKQDIIAAIEFAAVLSKEPSKVIIQK